MRMNIYEDERSLIRYIRYNIRCHDLFVSTTYGRAKAGNVTINARDTITFDGTAADSTEGNRNPSGVFSKVQEGVGSDYRSA